MAPATSAVCTEPRTAILLAAHGERRKDASNEAVFRLVRALSDRALAAEVEAGFINGVPTIAAALDALTAARIIVYPLFASSGYFTRDRLVALIDEANREGRHIRILPPLGLDPGLPDLVVAFARNAARERGFAARASNVILLAHGSRRNSASRNDTERIAEVVRRRAVFAQVEPAFLEERPFLADTASTLSGPTVVVGLFSGEGLHGARDAPRLIVELGRDDVAYAGVVGSAQGIEDVVARSVGEAILQDIRSRTEVLSMSRLGAVRDGVTSRQNA
ncbi:hypothetical protein KUL72_11630 [Bradyrhizobium arachidis]|uniref:CbiX/SirB N-terminal domain-containing protein n=1 Tax=Bradyrhizobium arachidis TaxID=858423 RepID=UPI002163186E|nr:CbiX/SirB N-terminal domain-containing protein [Bradyrhizobium arachidis]UVO38954.1 hypothetical protein KUL72_11630 [Bradyrhizobium arachidis]